jgi:hypothetical protein
VIEDPTVERVLQVEQGLVEALATGPAKHGHGKQHFANGSVSGQPAALAAAVDDEGGRAVRDLVLVRRAAVAG